jgi:hypothetical protein
VLAEIDFCLAIIPFKPFRFQFGFPISTHRFSNSFSRGSAGFSFASSRIISRLRSS